MPFQAPLVAARGAREGFWYVRVTILEKLIAGRKRLLNPYIFAGLRGSFLRFPPIEATKPEVPRQKISCRALKVENLPLTRALRLPGCAAPLYVSLRSEGSNKA